MTDGTKHCNTGYGFMLRCCDQGAVSVQSLLSHCILLTVVDVINKKLQVFTLNKYFIIG